MSANRSLLDWLLAENRIRIEDAAVLAECPPVHTTTPAWDRVEGMLLGLAVGDALGAPTEGIRPRLRRRIFAEIRDYPENPGTGLSWGYPSDDTQLAFWTLEQMLQDGCFVPEHVARCFCERPILGIGSTVAKFVRQHRDDGLPWYDCGLPSAGNGALMRIAPRVVPHLESGTSDLWVDTALAAMITHNDPASIASCVAFVRILWELLGMPRPPASCWWRTTFVATAKPLEGETRYRPRGGAHRDYEGPLWRFVDEQVRRAERRRPATRVLCNSWWSGAYLLEAVPCALGILARHAGNPEEAIVRAVNDTKDNDTIAAIVGAAVGALHGRSALPQRWIRRLTGRTHDADGHVFHLLDAARERWGATAAAQARE